MVIKFWWLLSNHGKEQSGSRHQEGCQITQVVRAHQWVISAMVFGELISEGDIRKDWTHVHIREDVKQKLQVLRTKDPTEVVIAKRL